MSEGYGKECREKRRQSLNGDETENIFGRNRETVLCFRKKQYDLQCDAKEYHEQTDDADNPEIEYQRFIARWSWILGSWSGYLVYSRLKSD
jgi:hypothetical protein